MAVSPMLRRKMGTVEGGSVVVRRPKLHAGQRILAKGQRRFNVAQCGRRLGKTTFGKERAINPVLRGHAVGWFAPTYKLLKDTWRDLKARLEPVIKDKDEQEHRLELLTGGVLEMWTLDRPDAGRGKDYRRIIVDESGLVRDLEERWNADIRPTLTLTRGDAWFLGTPKGRKFFHDLYRKGQSQKGEDAGEWASWRLGSIHNPLVTPEEVAAAKRDLPPHVFDQEYLGIPAEDGGNPFGLKAIAACTNTLQLADASGPFVRPPNFAARRRYVAGVDLARAEDYTVVAIFDATTGECVALDRFRLPWEMTIPRVATLLKTYKARYLVDATGVGDKVARDILAATRGHAEGELFVFSGPSKQGLMERLMTALATAKVSYPMGWLVNELESFGYEYTKHGVRYEAPQGLHDDGVMALGLAVAALDRLAINAADASSFQTVRK